MDGHMPAFPKVLECRKDVPGRRTKGRQKGITGQGWRWRQKPKGACLWLHMSSRDKYKYAAHLMQQELGDYSKRPPSAISFNSLIFIHSYGMCWASPVPLVTAMFDLKN